MSQRPDPFPSDDTPLDVQAGYAAWSSLYDDDGNPLTALEGPVVRAWFGNLLGKRALDVGCGTGRHTLSLAEAGASVTALDLTPEMIARAREKLAAHNVNWLRHALPDPLPFRDRTFDIAVLGLILEHLERPDLAFTEVRRVLRPGGRCVASALHSDRTAEGQVARFIDPETGRRRPIVSYPRTTDEYLAAARAADLTLLGEQTLVVSPELGARLPRATRYVGKPLGWVACWTA